MEMQILPRVKEELETEPDGEPGYSVQRSPDAGENAEREIRPDIKIKQACVDIGIGDVQKVEDDEIPGERITLFPVEFPLSKPRIAVTVRNDEARGVFLAINLRPPVLIEPCRSEVDPETENDRDFPVGLIVKLTGSVNDRGKKHGESGGFPRMRPLTQSVDTTRGGVRNLEDPDGIGARFRRWEDLSAEG